jgi:parvulin-like peptidyl-prolyl isomerase
MAKKTDEKSKVSLDKNLDRKKAVEEEEVDEEEDEDEDYEDEDEDEDDDDEAVPAKASDRRHRPHAHDDDDDEARAPAEEDPSWWAPHAVLGVLVVVGILGFFGVFNKVLGFLAATPGGIPSNDTSTSQPASKPATQPTQPAQQQQQPQQPQQMQPQPPREMFGAKHLLVMYKGSRRAPPNIERSQDEAKARAEEAAKKAKDPKNKFEDLVKEYSDEPGAGARGGDLGRFPKGAMVPEFQNALEKLKVNETSGVVESPFGYHVILRTQ